MIHKDFAIVEYFTYFMGLYVQIIPMIVTSYYYCGLILHCLHYLRTLNKKLSKIVQCNEKESLRLSSDDIQKISIIYGNICDLNRKMNGTFGCQMIMFLLNTFFMSLSAVGVSKFSNQIRFYNFTKLFSDFIR